MAKKPYKRKDGKPTRAERSEVNKVNAKTIRELLDRANTPITSNPTRRGVEDADIETVLDSMAAGMTVNEVCRQLGISSSSVRRALQAPELAARYAQAKELKALAMLEKNMALLKTLEEADPAAEGANNQIQAIKLIVTENRWIMSKLNQGVFGDKVTQVHTGDPSNPVVTKDISEMTTQEKVEEYRRQVKSWRPA